MGEELEGSASKVTDDDLQCLSDNVADDINGVSTVVDADESNADSTSVDPVVNANAMEANTLSPTPKSVQLPMDSIGNMNSENVTSSSDPAVVSVDSIEDIATTVLQLDADGNKMNISNCVNGIPFSDNVSSPNDTDDSTQLNDEAVGYEGENMSAENTIPSSDDRQGVKEHASPSHDNTTDGLTSNDAKPPSNESTETAVTTHSQPSNPDIKIVHDENITSNRSPQIILGFRRESDTLPAASNSLDDTPHGEDPVLNGISVATAVSSASPHIDCGASGGVGGGAGGGGGSAAGGGGIDVTCQTEWSWLEDLKASQKMRNASSRTTRSIINTTGARSSSISLSGVSGRRTPSKATSAVELAGSARSKLESAFSGENFTPVPLRKDEYGIPVLCISSDDESDDGEHKFSGKLSARTLNAITPLPSIGPPPILQYQPESKKVEIPSPIMDQQKRLVELQNNAINGGLKCDFCSALIKSFPTLDDQKEFPPDVLFCCNDYKVHLYAALSHPDAAAFRADTKIDTAPHPPYGSKHARKVAKERAALRMREREMVRQQASFATAQPAGNSNAGVSGFFQFARQMKTINYMLSSQRCMDEGWTIRPPSPLVEFLSKADLFEPEPILPSWVTGFETTRLHCKLVRRFYDNGNLFATQFPDGTGSVFHENGRPAITISSVELGVYTYVLQNAVGVIVGVFYTGGHCFTDFSHSKPRLNITKVGGIELNEFGARKRCWTWYTKEHVHAPPIQPIIFNVADKKFGVRVNAQDNIVLSFTSSKRACKFQVGSKLKPYSMDELEPVKVVDENLKYRKQIQRKVRDVLRRISDLLHFPNTCGSKFKCSFRPGVGDVTMTTEVSGSSSSCDPSATTTTTNTVTVTAGPPGGVIDTLGSGGSSRGEGEEAPPPPAGAGANAAAVKSTTGDRRPSRRLRKLHETAVTSKKLEHHEEIPCAVRVKVD